MNKFWKRLFCGHVYKETDREFLRESRDVDVPGSYGSFTTYADFKYYAITEECVKCGKVIIYEKRYKF